MCGRDHGCVCCRRTTRRFRSHSLGLNLGDPSRSPRWFREGRIAISFASALEMFVNPAGVCSAFSLFLIPDIQNTVIRKLGGVFAVLSLLFFVAFAFLAYAVRYRINKQAMTHPTLISVKCLYTSLASLLCLILQMLFFVASFILFYVDRLDAALYLEIGFWFCVCISGFVVVLIFIVWWYHVKLSDISPQRPSLDRIASLRGGYLSDSQVPREKSLNVEESTRDEL